MTIYYDPTMDVEIQSEGVSHPSWIAITSAMAESLGNARKAGARIYVNESNIPTAFYTPSKPELAWNETAHLMPFEIVNGAGSQYWAVTKIPIEDQADALAALRWQKQTSAYLYIDVHTGEWEVTTDPQVAGSIYIPTDALTMTTLMGIKADYDKGIDVTRDWKVSSLNFVSFTNAQLSTAYVKGQEYWQLCFSIERHYAELIKNGKDVNIMEWSIQGV